MTAKRPLIRTLLPLVVSAAAIGLLAALVDFDEIRQVRDRVEWRAWPQLVGVIVALVMAVAWRWHRLLSGTVRWPVVLRATALGLGSNQVLPARGGDLVRAVQTSRWSGTSVHYAISKLVLEKLLDLVAVAVVGLLALTLLLGQNADSTMRRVGLITSAVILIVAVGLLVLARTGGLARLVHAAARVFRIPARLYRHAYRPLFHLERAARGRALWQPLVLTAGLWLFIYPFAYFLIADAVGVSLSKTEAILVLCAGALGLALPAAPSGIGTYHASIVSGFLLFGRSSAEGLAVAIAAHAVFFIGFGASGALALYFAARTAPTSVPGD